MRGRRYAVYSPSRRSIASGYARVWLERYERSWAVLAASISVLRAQSPGRIEFEAQNTLQAAPAEPWAAIPEVNR